MMELVKNMSIYTNHCWIGGAWVESDTNKMIDVFNPFDGKIIDNVPHLSGIQIEKSIDIAYKAQKKWRDTLPAERRELLHKWQKLILENISDLAKILVLEQGKPYAEAEAEIKYSLSYLDFYADEAIRMYGETVPTPFPKAEIFVIKEAVGVVGIIPPWNFPAAMFIRKVAPALAAGCTCVLKPDEKTPLTAFALMKLASLAGIPDGVLNCVTGNPAEIGKLLCLSKKVKKISFTGSFEVGSLLMKQSSSTVKKITLELGGNAPFIVFSDANINAAVKGLMAAKFRNAGQTCVAANRVFVHDSIYNEFADALKKEVISLKLGNGLDNGINIGPIIDKDAIDKLDKYVNDSIKDGAKVLCGTGIWKENENFYTPTILCDVTDNMPIMIYESFGPIVPLARFHDDNEVIERANNTDYGLACYFYSESIKRISHVKKNLEYGMIGVNTGVISSAVIPFGGIKQSGFGREGSRIGLDEYTTTKYICIQN